MNCLGIRLSGDSGPVGHVNVDTERPHNVHANETWRQLQSHNDDKTGPTTSLTPLKVQMLGFTRNMERFAMRTVHRSLKWLQGPPLGAVAPPDGKSQACYRRSSVHKIEARDAFERQLAGDGWAYRAPNRGYLGLR